MYCIYSNQAAIAYSSLCFFNFLFYNFQIFKIFVTFLSGTVRPRRLKLGTHVDNGWMYCVYRNQAAAAYLSLSFFIFLSNFQTLKVLVTFFTGTVRPRRLKLGTHMNNGWIYRVYRIRLLLLIHPFIFYFFFLSNFQALNIFIGVFLGTMRPRRLKLRTNMNSGWMYCVY